MNLLRVRKKQDEFQIRLKNRFDILTEEEGDTYTRSKEKTRIILDKTVATAPPHKNKDQRMEQDKEFNKLDRRRKKLREKNKTNQSGRRLSIPSYCSKNNTKDTCKTTKK